MGGREVRLRAGAASGVGARGADGGEKKGNRSALPGLAEGLDGDLAFFDGGVGGVANDGDGVEGAAGGSGALWGFDFEVGSDFLILVDEGAHGAGAEAYENAGSSDVGIRLHGFEDDDGIGLDVDGGAWDEGDDGVSIGAGADGAADFEVIAFLERAELSGAGGGELDIARDVGDEAAIVVGEGIGGAEGEAEAGEGENECFHAIEIDVRFQDA
jgi:hypothetical protein